jgi:galactose mutarotase-like enzyme
MTGYAAAMFTVTGTDVLTLRDEDARSSVSIVPARGAIATSFRVGERELLYLDEATLRDPTKNVRGGIPVLFPSPGKLEGDRFARAGKQGSMKQHGFARELPWTVASTGTDGGASATLTLASDDRTRAQYPWDFRIAITFTLRAARLGMDVRVENTGGDAMPFAFGIHPYFLVTDKAHARVTPGATRAFDNVKKEIVPFHGFDLTAREVDVHLIDHGSAEGSLTWADGSSLTLRASPTPARWVVWTVEGKDYVCLEPWTAPGNALGTGEHLVTLEPRGTTSLSIAMEYAPPPGRP